jgi:hypothetical protein
MFDLKVPSHKYLGFEVLRAVVMKSSIFWDIAPCGLLKIKRHFGGTYRLHLRGGIISRAGNQRESRWQAELCLFVLFFDPEEVGDMFL